MEENTIDDANNNRLRKFFGVDKSSEVGKVRGRKREDRNVEREEETK